MIEIRKVDKFFLQIVEITTHSKKLKKFYTFYVNSFESTWKSGKNLTQLNFKIL